MRLVEAADSRIGNPQVEPFDFLEGEKVDFPEQFDDLGLVRIHARIMAAVRRLGCKGPSGRWRSDWEPPVLAGGVSTCATNDHMATDEDLKKEIERLRAENEALKKPARGQMSLKVSEKGGLSVYGLGRFPVTLYKEQWIKLLGMADEIRNFIRENDSSLKTKE